VPATRRAPAAGRTRINPVIDRLGATSWRLVGVGLVFVASVWVLARLWVVVLAVAVATLFARGMNPVAVWLRARGLKPALVAATIMIGFALLMAGIIAALVPAVANEFDELGPTIDKSIDDLEDWLVDDSPFDVSRADVRNFREDAGDRVSDTFSSSSQSSIVQGTTVAFEVITALILSAITSFFILKDGERFGRWLQSFVPDRHQPLTTRLARKAWWTLGGYLKGAAILGLVEGVIMALTVWLAGGTLAVPVGVITFFAAFIPFAGGVVAGAIAVLVTLVTGGLGGAEPSESSVTSSASSSPNSDGATSPSRRARRASAMTLMVTAETGTANSAPTGPMRALPPARAKSTTSGCSSRPLP